MYLNGNYYIEVNDKRYIIQPEKNDIFRLHEEPKSVAIQVQGINKTLIRRNRKHI